ncbi:hypothetical protein [Nostoc sp. NZL]|nr:hypothetical protein [Nostoc sp. NZL]
MAALNNHQTNSQTRLSLVSSVYVKSQVTQMGKPNADGDSWFC